MMRKGKKLPASPASNFPIAVVDDDYGVRSALCNLLDSAGYRCDSFAAGEDFLAADFLQEAACAIVDVGLTQMSGFELAEQLALARPGLPVIFISAHGSQAQQQRATQLGATALLVKPFDADILLAHLRHVLT
jgi:FixJ family two-component response regulator